MAPEECSRLNKTEGRKLKKIFQLSLLTISAVAPVSVVRHALGVGLGREPQLAGQTARLVVVAV